MKAFFISVLFLGTTLTASAIGHPHNMFSAHQKAKAVTKTTTTVSRSTSATPARNVFTAYAKAAAPSVVAFGWEIVKKSLL